MDTTHHSKVAVRYASHSVVSSFKMPSFFLPNPRDSQRNNRRRWDQVCNDEAHGMHMSDLVKTFVFPDGKEENEVAKQSE